MESSRLTELNRLAKKEKAEGLTAEEVSLRDTLRKEYLAAFRANLTAQLENTYIVDDRGNKRKLEKKK